MRRIAPLILAFVLLGCGGPIIATYTLAWNTSDPIKPETIAIAVVGGEVYGSSMNLRHTIGSVEAIAPVECVSIAWQAETKSGGTAYASYFWDRDCPGVFERRLFLPLLRSSSGVGRP
jgi:hypothetical protein